MDEVANEVKALDEGFRVTDLHSRFANLGKANGNVAWTISYSTSSANVEPTWRSGVDNQLQHVERGGEKGLTGGR